MFQFFSKDLRPSEHQTGIPTFTSNATHSHYQMFEATNVTSIDCSTRYCRIVCGAQHVCEALNIAALSSTELMIECTASYACANLTFEAPNSLIRINCGEVSSCRESHITIRDAKDVQFNCHADSSCRDADYQIDIATVAHLNITCDGYEACAFQDWNLKEMRHVTIVCVGTYGCYGSDYMIQSQSGDLSIECDGTDACRFSNYDIKSQGDVTLSCDGAYACGFSNYRVVTNGSVSWFCSTGYASMSTCTFTSFATNHTAETILVFAVAEFFNAFGTDISIAQAGLARVYCGESTCQVLDFEIDARAAIFDLANETDAAWALHIDGSAVESRYVVSSCSSC